MMRRRTCWAVGLGSLTALAAASAEEEVKSVLRAQQEAWNRGDLTAFMSAYEDTPELAFVGKEVTRGWRATLERYQRTYPTRAAMGTLAFSALEVHEVAKGVAWVYGRFALERTAEGGGAASGRFTLLVRRGKKGWKILLDHTAS